MNEDAAFLEKHRSRGAIFDTNLLLVYVVGKLNRSDLGRFMHTKQYEEDFPFIEFLIERHFDTIFTTPHILTEVSNLGKDFLSMLSHVVPVLDERSVASKEVAKDEMFSRLGLTDAALIRLGGQILVVTVDLPLYQVLRSKQIDAVNFNHLRPVLWHIWQTERPGPKRLRPKFKT